MSSPPESQQSGQTGGPTLEEMGFPELTANEILFWSRWMNLTPAELFSLPRDEFDERLKVAQKEISEHQRREHVERLRKYTAEGRHTDGLRSRRTVWQILTAAATEIESTYGIGDPQPSQKSADSVSRCHEAQSKSSLLSTESSGNFPLRKSKAFDSLWSVAAGQHKQNKVRREQLAAASTAMQCACGPSEHMRSSAATSSKPTPSLSPAPSPTPSPAPSPSPTPAECRSSKVCSKSSLRKGDRCRDSPPRNVHFSTVNEYRLCTPSNRTDNSTPRQHGEFDRKKTTDASLVRSDQTCFLPPQRNDPVDGLKQKEYDERPKQQPVDHVRERAPSMSSYSHVARYETRPEDTRVTDQKRNCLERSAPRNDLPKATNSKPVEESIDVPGQLPKIMKHPFSSPEFLFALKHFDSSGQVLNYVTENNLGSYDVEKVLRTRSRTPSPTRSSNARTGGTLQINSHGIPNEKSVCNTKETVVNCNDSNQRSAYPSGSCTQHNTGTKPKICIPAPHKGQRSMVVDVDDTKERFSRVRVDRNSSPNNYHNRLSNTEPVSYWHPRAETSHDEDRNQQSARGRVGRSSSPIDQAAPYLKQRLVTDHRAQQPSPNHIGYGSQITRRSFSPKEPLPYCPPRSVNPNADISAQRSPRSNIPTGRSTLPMNESSAYWHQRSAVDDSTERPSGSRIGRSSSPTGRGTFSTKESPPCLHQHSVTERSTQCPSQYRLDRSATPTGRSTWSTTPPWNQDSTFDDSSERRSRNRVSRSLTPADRTRTGSPWDDNSASTSLSDTTLCSSETRFGNRIGSKAEPSMHRPSQRSDQHSLIANRDDRTRQFVVSHVCGGSQPASRNTRPNVDQLIFVPAPREDQSYEVYDFSN